MGTQLKNYKEKNSYENLPLSFDVLQSEVYTHGVRTKHTDTNPNKDAENRYTAES